MDRKPVAPVLRSVGEAFLDRRPLDLPKGGSGGRPKRSGLRVREVKKLARSSIGSAPVKLSRPSRKKRSPCYQG
jgi:hypothetical protein